MTIAGKRLQVTAQIVDSLQGVPLSLEPYSLDLEPFNLFQRLV